MARDPSLVRQRAMRTQRFAEGGAKLFGFVGLVFLAFGYWSDIVETSASAPPPQWIASPDLAESGASYLHAAKPQPTPAEPERGEVASHVTYGIKAAGGFCIVISLILLLVDLQAVRTLRPLEAA